MTIIISILASTLGVLFVAFLVGHALGFLWTSGYCFLTRSVDPMGVKKSAVVTQFVFFAITLGIAFFLGRQIYEFGIWWLSSVFVLLGLFVALMFFSSNLRVGLQNYR